MSVLTSETPGVKNLNSVRYNAGLIDRLRSIAVRGLAHMYRPQERMFGFCVRRGPAGDVLEGTSRRYTAITLLGLAGEAAATVDDVLAGDRPAAVGARLLSDIDKVDNLGDVALTLWAARAWDLPGAGRAYERLCELGLTDRPQATVELSWALTALVVNDHLPAAVAIRDVVARRLLSAFRPKSGLFGHSVGAAGSEMRGHVACFADIVYPIHALANYHGATGDETALAAARQCAARACALQGPAGQWWWHYDVRNGLVIEGYPVYSVHQDSMAPMALFALAEAGGTDHGDAVRNGLDWLEHSQELDGGTLIDEESCAIWRKVARREPRKLTRRMQAAVSAVHPALRVPGTDIVFPAIAVDWECRPYHLAWILYAWSPVRLGRLGISEEAL